MAVIFDMDGVVSDTQRIHARLESEILASYGITMSIEEITRRFSGVSLREQFQAVFRESSIPCPDLAAISKLKTARFAECSDEIVEIPGTRECVEMLHPRMPLAIGSGSRLATIERVLGKLELRDRFRVITSAEEVERGKPAPDIFLLAAKRLGVEASRCTVIEDGISGMLAAKAAGMRCIALSNGYHTEYPADLVVSNLREVPLEYFL
ncbi:MAG TPA: HAD family phosphatase [Candidatus Paceibacterota bacterium]